MPDLFPYTNTHELNLDWVLQVVKDFQNNYSTIEQGIDDALAAIEEAKNGSLEEMQSALETAVNAIDAAYQQASTGINQARNNTMTAIQQQRADALSAIYTDKNEALSAINTDKNNALLDLQTALTTALASIATQQTNATQVIEQLYNTLPASAQDILGRLNILDNIIVGYTPSNAFNWLQGGYVYPTGYEPVPTPPAIWADDPEITKKVSSQYATGCAGQRMRITTDGTILIAAINCWYNTPPGGAPGGFAIGQEGLTPTFGDVIFPLNTTAFSIELVSSTYGGTITPTDIAGHIDVRWVTDFVDQATVAPKENSNTANIARETGDLFFLDGVLYRALDDIAVGDTIITSGAGANCQETSISSEIAAIEGGGGGGLDSIQIVANMAGLAASTADKVLVLHDDSSWGTGGPCWFEKSATWSTYGYQRNDNSYMFPVPNQAPLPEAHAPREQLVDIMQTWIGNPNMHHGSSYNNDLFSTNCARDESNLFEMDCSAYVNAVLLGITYDNSRYVLGESADNKEMQYMSDHIGPSKSEYMSKGGLQTSELAMWFAQHGRLFDLPADTKTARDTLQFGDILFGCSDTNRPSAYYNIEHVMFVLGANSNYVVVTESVSVTGAFEQQNLKISFYDLSTLIGPDKYFRVFARPKYAPRIQTPAITPYKQGTFKYNAFLLPISQIRRLTDASTGTSVNFGELYNDSRSMATVDYLPVIPLSTVKYIGNQKNPRNHDYNWRCHEYDETMALVKSTTIAYASNGEYIRTEHVLDSGTKYVRFAGYYLSATNDTIRFVDMKDFMFEITPPNPI